jgi:hypothetical protein
LESFATPYDSYLVEMASKEVDEPMKKRQKLVHSTVKTEKEIS